MINARPPARPLTGKCSALVSVTDLRPAHYQVLVEARSHAATSGAHQSHQHQHGPVSPTTPPPPPPGSRHSRDTTSGGGHHHKSWASKLLSFLKRPNKKRHHEAKVIPVQDAASNKARTPPKYKSAPLQQQHQPGRQQQQRQQQTSGPLYTDGTPLTPSHRSSKPKSGPLDAFQLPHAAESPYVPLRRCAMNSRLYSGPVYLS